MELIENNIILSKYQKQKEAILKWRNANKEKYLLKLHIYNKKLYADPEKKLKKLEQIKAYQKKKKDQQQEIKKRGRPSRYHDDELIIITK
jgi:hypothetical protein